MDRISKAVKLFNLEDRKNAAGTITEIDIFQWKNALMDNIKRDKEYQEHCLETSRWGPQNEKDRGFEDTETGDGSARLRADQVDSMLTKISTYAPKSIVREITRRSRKLEDIWEVCRDWAGIRSNGTKHLEYYKTRKSYQKTDKDESPQEFYYRLRDSMEDTLIQNTNQFQENGTLITEIEIMTPTVRSLVVLDWLEAIGGPQLIEHIHRVYATELETETLASLQRKIWKNLSALLHEIEENDQPQQIQQCEVHKETLCRQVINNKRNSFKNAPQHRQSQDKRVRKFQQNANKKNLFCKMCKASGSPNFRSHNIAECWLLNDHDRSEISKASAKANAMFAYEEEQESEVDSEQESSDENQ